MSSLSNSQFLIEFKANATDGVSQKEVELLANWIEEILLKVSSDEINLQNVLLN